MPRSGVACLLAIVVMAGLVRFTGLNANDFWVDESCTYYATHHLFDLPTDGPQLTKEIAHLPYFFLLRGWSEIFGQTPVGLRSFSALTGCLGVLAIAWLAWTIGGRRTCLIAAALAAMHPLHIHYSQEARVYSLWILEGALCITFLYKAAASGHTRYWCAYVVLAIVAVMTHYYTLFWLPAGATAVMVASDRKRFMKQWLIAYGVLAIALVPAIWFLVIPISEGGPRPWLKNIWLSYPPSLSVAKSLWTMLSAGDYPAYLGATANANEVLTQRVGVVITQIIRFLPATIVATLVITFYIRFFAVHLRKSKQQADASVKSTEQILPLFNHIVMSMWLLILSSSFLLNCWAWSTFVRPIYVVGRYDAFAMPAIIVAVALLISKPITIKRFENSTRQAILSGLLTVMLVACSTAVVLASRAAPVNRDISARAARIDQQLEDNDLLICIGASKWFMVYEWDQLGIDARIVSFPRAHDRQLCWDDPEAESKNPGRLDADLTELDGLIESTLAGHQKVWLLLRGENADARWQVDQRFFAYIRSRGLSVEPVDEDAGLARLRPTPRKQ